MTEVAGHEREIAALIGKLFVQRRDVKAEQNKFTGIWAKRATPMKMPDLVSHIRGERSIGHYLIDHDNMCRVFALDIDLVDTKMETLKDHDDPEQRTKYKPCFYPSPSGDGSLIEYNPRTAWQDRAHPARAWTKRALRIISEEIAVVVVAEMELPCLVSYSGSKGMHVYALLHESVGGPGPISADLAREGAIMVLERTEKFVPGRGKNFYRAIDQDPLSGFPQLEVEIFPKQGSIGEKGFGNLMRLPLGRNFKSEKDVSFFVDMDCSYETLRSVDPMWALTGCNPFRDMSIKPISYINVGHSSVVGGVTK